MLEAAESARHIANVASDKQASDILVLNIGGVCSFTDFFVIMTATSRRHMAALAEDIAQEVKGQGVRLLGSEGIADSGWMLLDCGDVIVHIFGPEERAYYRLEEVWQLARPVLRIE